jgi:hypothetical protein
MTVHDTITLAPGDSITIQAQTSDVPIEPPTEPPTEPPSGLPLQGFSIDSQFKNLSPSDQQFVLNSMKDLSNGHSSWSRVDWWPATPGSDQAIQDNKNAGFVVMGLWNLPYNKREDQALYAQHAAQLAGIVDLVNVHNEPDMSGWPAATAAQYALASYKAIKAANSKCVVCGPSLWKTSTQKVKDGYDYAKAMLAATNGERFYDLWDEHLYDDPNLVDPSWNKWDWVFRNNGTNVRALLDSYPNWKGTPIIATEAGGNADRDGDAYQNDCVAHGMDARASLGLASFGVYTILNIGVSAPGFGLFNNNRNKRAAYESFKSRSR